MARRGEADYLRPYKMTADRLGICLIFNNRTFPIGMRERTGTEYDKEKLHAIFQTLKFDVRCYDDVSDTDMLGIISRAAQEDHTRYNCFVCCILSHGATGVVYGSNGDPIEIHKLTERLCPQSCPTLCGKPKVFIVQACMGKRVQRGHPEVQIDSVAAEDMLIPNEADFLVAYSTVPGYVAFRNKTKGSYFIQALVEKLYKHAHEFDILRILTCVNYTVGSKDFLPAGEDIPQKQSPSQFNTLQKVLYLSRTPLNASPHPQSDESTVVRTPDGARRQQQRGRVPDASRTVPSALQQDIEGDRIMALQLQLLEYGQPNLQHLRRKNEEDMRIGPSRGERTTLLSLLAHHKPDSSRNAATSTGSTTGSTPRVHLQQTERALLLAGNARGNRPDVGTYRHRDHPRFAGFPYPFSNRSQQAGLAPFLLAANVHGNRSRVDTQRHRGHQRLPFFPGLTTDTRSGPLDLAFLPERESGNVYGMPSRETQY